MFTSSFLIFVSIVVSLLASTGSQNVNNWTGYIEKQRPSRTSTLAKKGLDALDKLLKGTTKLKSQSRRYRKYKKDGDFQTAEKDFYSVNPKNVKNYAGRYGHSYGKVMIGSVGDRHLILNSVGDKGNPILEVVETAIHPGQYVDRIIYKKPSN